jgi:hypothetical protein
MSVMYVATLDILTEKGGFNPQAARAIGEAIDLEIARSRDASATREDVGECRRALGEELGLLRGDTDRNFSGVRSEMSALRSELKEDIAVLRCELKGDISALRSELKEDIAVLRCELKGDISALRSELKEDIALLRSELKGGTGTLKVDMQTMKADLVRWVFVVVIVIGQTAMLLGVFYFFTKFVR